MMFNVVFFINSLDSGGIENYLLRFLKSKNGSFNNIYIYCKSGHGGQLESDYLKIKNVTIIKKKISFFAYRNINFVKLFLVENDIHSVCDFTGNFSGLVLMVSYKSGVKRRIAFYRGSTNHFKPDVFRNFYNRLMNKMVKKYATNILSNSISGFEFFFPKYWRYDNRFDVIYNGINAKELLKESGDLREDFNIPSTAFVIGHTGRYNSAKNHETILSVAKILIEKYSDIYFILCGNGVKKNIQDFLKIEGLDGRLLVFENRNDIPLFLNTMDCYFFPSITEGQPNALIEAMVMGIPYVASNIEPIKETVINMDDLYNPKDTESFVSALEYKYKEKTEHNILYQKKVIEKFDADKCFSDFYERLSI